ncbi:Ger(x)C family spore germination protein [Paenalkalicoccus suaedae]|uniref:Ger(X)C family spore germination protein n=1 Tax=Paenalkalicoccus suaedae TaxID=2592382 RepID=A0A859FE01_9BACI|nr:Ger(x)C family spore germination protein [Paenalkalicoccus suaedae]QKS70814.1 Ger(x)C family spore germination protein [Paenalkalicoccus suaedae]
MRVILFILCILLCTSCWDARQLRDITVVKASAIDVSEEGHIILSVASLVAASDQRSAAIQIESAIDHSERGARLELESRYSESIDFSKLRTLFVSNKVAENDIYPYLDAYYRSPRGALASKLVIVDGLASQIINIQPTDRPHTSELVADMVHAGEQQTLIPITNIQLVCPFFFDDGSDALIPVVKLENGKPVLNAVAIFNNKQMSGTLNLRESKLILLMKGAKQSRALLVNQVNDSNEGENIENFISYKVEKAKSSLKVDVDPSADKVTARVNTKLEINVLEFPHDKLTEPGVIKDLEELLTQQLTDEALEVFKKLQEANCDALGVGKRVFAFHPSYYEQKSWKERYPSITIEPSIQVEIVRHGVLD